MSDYQGEVLDLEVARYALRTFKVKWGRLGSVIIPGQHWRKGTCEATCHRPPACLHPPHFAPAEHCTCGVYGSLSYDHLLFSYPRQATRILAVIAAEGVTIIGTRGLRTQYARVVAFWAKDERLVRIAARYLPEATAYPYWLPMLKDFGITQSPELDHAEEHAS